MIIESSLEDAWSSNNNITIFWNNFTPYYFVEILGSDANENINLNISDLTVCFG